jgi:hypothetical protein
MVEGVEVGGSQINDQWDGYGVMALRTARTAYGAMIFHTRT